jgi:hypothetical protein
VTACLGLASDEQTTSRALFGWTRIFSRSATPAIDLDQLVAVNTIPGGWPQLFPYIKDGVVGAARPVGRSNSYRLFFPQQDHVGGVLGTGDGEGFSIRRPLKFGDVFRSEVRDLVSSRAVERHLHHSADPHQRLDFIGAKFCARGKGHSVSGHYSLKKGPRSRYDDRDGLPAIRN